MGTWFWYLLKAKNALSLKMATNSAANWGIFFYSSKKKKSGENITISFIFGVLRSNKLLFLHLQSHFRVFQPIFTQETCVVFYC